MALFIKGFYLDVLQGFKYASALEIFIIKPNLICANNNPKFHNFFRKSEVASKRKTSSTAVNGTILYLVEFLDLPLRNYIATTLH